VFYQKLLPAGEIENKNSLLKSFIILEGKQQPVEGYMHDFALLADFDLEKKREKYRNSFMLYLVARNTDDNDKFVREWEFEKITLLPEKLYLIVGMYDRSVRGIDWVLSYM
jgi:hypothetical protein